MASLYRQKKSIYWWIKFRDPATGQTKRESTGFKIGVGLDTKKAREVCATRSLAEAKSANSVPSAFNKERWERWVPDYLAIRYRGKDQTLLRYHLAWENVSLFLCGQEILRPRQLTRNHCMAFMEWRKVPDKSHGKRRAGHNTALLELKVLSLVMKEAVLREFSPFNPCRELGLKRDAVKEKPEYTEEDFVTIQEQIAKEPEQFREFYSNSFNIARYQGCRISETHLNPMKDVKLPAKGDKGGHILFTIKGGKIHVAPLHPQLIPLFGELIARGATETYQSPKSPSKMWWNLLTRCGLKAIKAGACFHSLRVTAVTKLARSRVISEAKAMAFIGHASTTVHRSYQRLRPEDLGDCLEALS